MNEKRWFSDKIVELQDNMYRFSYSILKNEMDAQDAVQETIYKAYKRIETLNDKKKFKTWIYVILRNTSLEMLKNKKTSIEVEEDLQEKTEDVDIKMTLWDIVQNLQEPYRTTIILYYYENLTIKEISKIINKKEDAVKQQLSRGRKKIKEVIKL